MTTAKEILRKDYLAAGINDTLAQVNRMIKDEAFSEVLVFDKEKLVGIFSPSRASMIRPSKENMGQMRIEKLVKSINPIDEDTVLNEIMIKLSGTGYKIVPVSVKGKVTGIVHLFDLLDAYKFNGLKVSDLELQKPIELAEDEKIRKAIQVLHENMNDTVLVKDKEDTHVGILNRYDLLRNLKLDSYKFDKKNVKNYKSEKGDFLALPISDFIRGKNFVSVSNSDTITEVIEQFKENRVTSMIVGDISSLIRWQDILIQLKKSQMVKTKEIVFVGLEELKLDNFVVLTVKEITQTSHEKIKDIIQQDANLKVHIKRHFDASKNTRNKYSIALHLKYGGEYISIGNVSDWDLTIATKTAIKQLENRINRIFRSKGAESRNASELHNQILHFSESSQRMF